MGRNSSKAAESGNPHVLALSLAHAWLEQNGGQQRIPTALRYLIEATQTAIERGEPPPEKDSLTLGELWRLQRGGEASGVSVALRGADVARWWRSRQTHLQQFYVDHGSPYRVELDVHPGGGRHHAARFSLRFSPVEAVLEQGEAVSLREMAAPAVAPPDPDLCIDEISYRIDPAEPAFWLRALVGRRPFPLNSWRGYVLLGSAAINFALIALLGFLTYVDWNRARPITTREVANLALSALVAGGLWVITRPIRQLPARRVTSAGAGYLAFTEFYGQLRSIRDTNRRLGSREFSVVRHWAVCPLCSAEVDLEDGGRAFPDRLVGRCHDAPTEHVFSFDPVSLTGLRLQ